MIFKDGIAEWITRPQYVEPRANKDGAVPVAHDGIGQRHDVVQSAAPSRGDEQYDVTFRIVGSELRLVSVIAAKLPLDRFHVLLRTCLLYTSPSPRDS